ncbi:MAG TPA: DNA-directed RNA polymerase subunit alpha [bacterium]|nr:DNA-directed RNA polymerase subunit alpha [bacterium]HQO33837.1 DNA-directed RNA polymerase subunit alpha [bacterium]HQQ00766.1 DNA-directed RNA polymerase subunit alpha [bacterium]
MIDFKSVVMPGRVIVEPDTLTDRYGKFTVEPLERGFGTTLGNSLRRVLISSIQGAAVRAIRITDVAQEVSAIPGVVEDVTDIVLNVKSLRVKNHRNGPVTLFLEASGEGEVTAESIQPNPDIEILNKDLHLATLSEDGRLEMELYVDVGRGYLPADTRDLERYPQNTILVDAVFTPIERVQYTVENARVGDVTDYDRLILQIWTDGTVRPVDALSFASKILKDHLVIFMNFEEEEPPVADQEADGQSDINPLLFKGVEELDLSVRAYNCLKAANVKTIGDLVQRQESEMLKYRNFGKKSLTEIKAVLANMGLGLGMTLPEASLASRPYSEALETMAEAAKAEEVEEQSEEESEEES